MRKKLWSLGQMRRIHLSLKSFRAHWLCSYFLGKGIHPVPTHVHMHHVHHSFAWCTARECPSSLDMRGLCLSCPQWQLLTCEHILVHHPHLWARLILQKGPSKPLLRGHLGTAWKKGVAGRTSATETAGVGGDTFLSVACSSTLSFWHQAESWMLW